MGELPHLPVTSHLGATLNFETLERQISELQEEGKRRTGGGVSAWSALALSSKAEALEGFQTPGSRTEQGGTTARLRGIVRVKAGQEVLALGTLATIPVGARPQTTVDVAAYMAANTIIILEITTAGLIKPSSAVKSEVFVLLDGITFNLT